MVLRTLIVAGCLAANAAYLTWGVPDARPRPRVDLEQIPLHTDGWRGQSVPLDPAVLKLLPVDTYAHRYYTDSRGRRVNLYVGYHDDTRPAASLAPHSPLLCLPGLGWQPVETGRDELRVSSADAPGGIRAIAVTRVVAARALERQVVLFWYQVNEAAVADEFALKRQLIANVLHARRSSVTLVRVAVPVEGRGAATVPRADRTARDFAEAMFDYIQRRLVS